MKTVMKILGMIGAGSCLIIILVFSIVHISAPRKISLDIGSLTLLDRNGVVITKKWGRDGYRTNYTGSLDIPLIRAIVEVEDRRYWQHLGIDIPAKIGSLWNNIQAGSIVRWGSTLTEQYIKNTYFPLERRTWQQKIIESVYATEETLFLKKDETLRNYLNSIYFGDRIFWIDSYLKTYYPEYSISELPQEAIVDIIARIRIPNADTWSLDAYKKQVAKKLNWDIATLKISPRPSRNLPRIDTFPLLTLRVQKELENYCDGRNNTLTDFVIAIPDTLCQDSEKVLRLSIDSNVMRYSQDTLDGILWTLTTKNVEQGAIFIYDSKNKKILTYIGSRKQDNSQASAIDMITRRRSVGSILKPLIYLMALKNGADTEDLILDAMRSYPTDQGKNFIPFNYIPSSYGPLPLKEALANSLNSATVRLTEHIGITKVYDTLRVYGLDLEHDVGHYGYGIGIGTAELSLENVVKSYAHLTDITQADEYLISETLKNPKNRARTFGISSILNTSIPLAVKTGTSTDFRDNWAISYSPEIIIGVWVGNVDGSSMRDVSGVAWAGPIWHNIAEYLITSGWIQNTPQTIPPWIHTITRCRDMPCYQKEYVPSKHIEPIPLMNDRTGYPLERFIGVVTDEEKVQYNIR